MTSVTNPQSTDSETTAAQSSDEQPLRIRYRIRFAKTGLLRWISHRDLARLWERLLRRAALRLSMTEGFHPKPRIAFPSALALGVEGANEVVEIELAELLEPAELLERLRKDDQPGLTIRSVGMLPDQFGKAQLQRGVYEIIAPSSGDGSTEADTGTVDRAIEQLLQRETVSIERKKKTITVDVNEQISELRYEDGRLHLKLESSDAASMKPTDVLDLLGFDNWIENGATIIRTDVVLQREFESDDDQLMAVAEKTT